MARTKVPQPVIREINHYLSSLKADKLSIKKAMLFGSYARGTQNKWSDIDLCVVSPQFTNLRKGFEYLWRKRTIRDIRYTIEPVGFSPKDFREGSPLIDEIKRTGIEIKV
jgi:predicted nucleotidyltransferase